MIRHRNEPFTRTERPVPGVRANVGVRPRTFRTVERTDEYEHILAVTVISGGHRMVVDGPHSPDVESFYNLALTPSKMATIDSRRPVETLRAIEEIEPHRRLRSVPEVPGTSSPTSVALHPTPNGLVLAGGF